MLLLCRNSEKVILLSKVSQAWSNVALQPTGSTCQTWMLKASHQLSNKCSKRETEGARGGGFKWVLTFLCMPLS